MLIRKLILSFLICTNLLISTYARADEKLIFAIDLIRHGDRTPTGVIPKAPHQWAEGLGQLTADGMQQEFQLGNELRQQYIDHYHLLPPSYQSNTLLVRSTDFDRTLMSAQSLLMGLYPLGTGPKAGLPSAYQPIPIHTRPLDQEDLFIPDIDPKRFEALQNQYVFSRADWKAKNAELQPKFPLWSQLTGTSITNLYQLKSLGDILYIYQVHHIPLPEGLSATDAETIINAGRFAMATSFKPAEIGSITGHALLAAVTKYLQDAATQSNTLKYVLLSGHDSSILTLMSAMHAPLDDVPRYASDLNFALFETGPGTYFVKIRFNNQPVFIPGCGSTACRLSQFVALSSQNNIFNLQ